ncbi:MAG TPA: hypothetical protein ENI95_03735 [Chloroflexi bacterium]|nr:hypothetical protein [Chloroflexota bacterium]
MARYTIWRVETYRLFQYAEGFRYQDRPVRALILLLEDGGDREVYAYFTEESPLPVEIVAENRIIVWYAYEQFAPVMEMLREEKPIYVHILNRPDRQLLALTTAEEPVGEGEG